MRLGDLDALKKEVVGMMINKADDLEEVEFEINSALASVCEKIDNAPTVEAFTKEDMAGAYNEGYACGSRENTRPQGEWIPVSERLPDKNMPCLVSGGKLNLTQIAMYSDLMETIDHKIFYIGDYGKDDFRNITEFVNAWQPLPEPYKKGGKK